MPGKKLGQLISEIEAQAGTSITDPKLLDHDVMLVNLGPTARPEAIVISDGAAGPVLYLASPARD